MGHQELAIDQINIGLHAAEAVIQGIEQRALVFIVVMGMGVDERHRFRAGAQRRQQEQPEPNQQFAWQRGDVCRSKSLMVNGHLREGVWRRRWLITSGGCIVAADVRACCPSTIKLVWINFWPVPGGQFLGFP